MRRPARAFFGEERMRFTVLVGLLALTAAGCRARANPVVTTAAPTASVGSSNSMPARDLEREACQARIASLEAEPTLSGAPAFDRTRAEVLGRARGEPMLFVREPARATGADAGSAPPRGAGAIRAALKLRAKDRAALRALLLREGYVYASDPAEALALVGALELTALFDEPTIHLARGADVLTLARKDGRFPSYRYADGRTAELLFGDRVATTREALSAPLHRDLRGLQRRAGFERARILAYREKGLVAELRFDGAWVKGLLVARGAELDVGCFDADEPTRRRVAAFVTKDAPRRNALKKLREAVDAQVLEAVPFDRPRDEKTAERDGELRPSWRFAYLHGGAFFSHDEQSYPVFDAQGRPLPPQMCVDFVLDSFERGAGTWFRPRGSDLGRTVGSLDFDALGIKNRRSVLAFEKFAEEHSDLFEHARMKPEERIPFGERSRFFSFLLEHADRFRPGDIVAIQGRKADGLIHQHAILIEDTDPLTGFPEALADQMKRPRRRTWEGIMAEAPLRSLLFHVRPKDRVLLALGEEAGAVREAVASSERSP